MADDEQRLRDVQREYLDFLDDEVNAKKKYKIQLIDAQTKFSILFAGGPRDIHDSGERHDSREFKAFGCEHK